MRTSIRSPMRSPLRRWRSASTSSSASPASSTSAMPRSLRSAPTPTASSAHGNCSRTGRASGSRSSGSDLVARNHTTAGDFVHFQVSFWLMLPLSAAIAASFGILFGAPTLRLKGDYLAIVTLGFGEIVPIVVRNWPSLTNGAMGLNGVAAPQLFGFNFGIAATPYYYVAVALVALLILISVRLKDFSGRPRLDGDPRGRDRRRGDGRRSRPLQAARLCDGCSFRRHDRHALYRQVADRDPGHVHVPGLGHDPRDDRVRRHRQRLGRRHRRADPPGAAILGARGPVRLAAHARPVRRRRLAAACRAGLFDRADLRPDPRLHDAVPARGADPGDAAGAGAEPRPNRVPRSGAAASTASPASARLPGATASRYSRSRI